MNNRHIVFIDIKDEEFIFQIVDDGTAALPRIGEMVAIAFRGVMQVRSLCHSFQAGENDELTYNRVQIVLKDVE